VDTCLSREDIARQSCAMVPRWRFFASCIFSEPRAARFRSDLHLKFALRPGQTDRQTGQRSDSIGRTVLQTVAQKPRESDISPMRRDAPTAAIILNFGMRGDIADVVTGSMVTHAKFYVNRFRVFGVLTPLIFLFSIGLVGRPYNSVSTIVLHCDRGCPPSRICDACVWTTHEGQLGVFITVRNLVGIDVVS